MDEITFNCARELAQNVIFGGSVCVADALVLLNWLDDNKQARIIRHRNGLVTLCYCSRCSTIVTEGDNFCHGCGRRLIDDKVHPVLPEWQNV